MSKYTTELRYICESMAGLDESAGADSVTEIVKAARTKIFGSYPIFDENYREELECKILKHYYGYEIGAETFGRFKLWLDTKMNEIMPYYNQLYLSAKLEFDPLTDVKYTRKGNRTDTGTVKSEGKGKVQGNGSNLNLFSDTPQGGIENIENEDYLTTVGKTTGNNVTDTESENTDTFDKEYGHEETIEGKMGGTQYADMLKKYRDTFLNIDMQVIGELKELFMMLW